MEISYKNKGVAFPEKIHYKGFDIEAAPYHLSESNGWSLNIFIYRHSADGVVSRNFYARNIFDTLDEAMRNGYIFGKKIIDGEIPNLRVEDLL